MEHPRWSWGTLAAIATVVGALGGLVVWVFGFLATERELKDHTVHDASVQAWNLYGFAANRLEYLDDKQAECDAKKMTQAKLEPIDAAICTRYEAKLKTKQTEAADLKSKALETTKEKP
jgi:hypothetical protein